MTACLHLYGSFLWQLKWFDRLSRWRQNYMCAFYFDLSAVFLLVGSTKTVVKITSSHLWESSQQGLYSICSSFMDTNVDLQFKYVRANRTSKIWSYFFFIYTEVLKMWTCGQEICNIHSLQNLGKVWTNWRKCFNSTFPLIGTAASTKRFHLHSTFSLVMTSNQILNHRFMNSGYIISSFYAQTFLRDAD